MANDEQIGNESYLTMTPGSAMAGQLQQILTSKRLEARQAMLDELNRRNTESEMAARADNAATNKANREALASDRAAQELGRRTALMSPHQNLAGKDEQFLQANAPSLIDPGEHATEPLPDGAEGPSRPEIPSKFHGLPAQLETEHKRQLQDDLMKSMSDPTKWDPMPDAQKEAMYRNAFGASVPENVLRPKVGGKRYLVDEATKTIIDGATGQRVLTNSFGPNDTFTNIPRPAPGPQPHAPTFFEGTNDATNEREVYGVGQDLKPSKVQFGSGFRVGGKAGTVNNSSGTKPAKTTPQTWGLWTTALQGVLKGNTQAEGQLNQQAAKIAQEMGLSPEAAEPVLEAFRNPTLRSRTPSFEHDDKATAAQSQQLWTLLTNGFKASQE